MKLLTNSTARDRSATGNPGANAETIVKRIVERSARMQEYSDTQLRDRATRLGQEHDPLEMPDDDYLVEAGALVREAAGRTIGMHHYEVQLLGGIHLARNTVAEMATGEGKTLTATLPATIYGLQRRGAHVMTVNPYLAERDHDLMQPVYQLLGLSCGLLKPGSSPIEKQAAYQCDITYGVGSEFGFDYLRDQMSFAGSRDNELGKRFRTKLRGSSQRKRQLAQRPHHFAIVDEADSVMIDEARSSLILSGSSGQPHPNPQCFILAYQVAASLNEGKHYSVDRVKNSITLLENARERIHEAANLPDTGLVRPWSRYIEQALRVRHLLQRDREYIVADDKIQIVDEYTGRRLEDRTWSEGLHQAVEAAENVDITEESYSMMRISRQRYLGFYRYLCGMTGTAVGCEKEFRSVFGLPVSQVPLRLAEHRRILPTRFYRDQEGKWQAILEEIEAVHATGQPMLIGTRTVADSERLASLLDSHTHRYMLLNARQDQDEARVIGMAGQPGTITIATNLAGRGADIPLGKGVGKLGGLYVLATEPQESARIDRQLAGRCARQGEPGTYRLYVSADDELLSKHGRALRQLMKLARHDKGRLHADFSGHVARIQRRLDVTHYKQRQHLYRQDKWMEDLLEKAV